MKESKLIALEKEKYDAKKTKIKNGILEKIKPLIAEKKDIHNLALKNIIISKAEEIKKAIL